MYSEVDKDLGDDSWIFRQTKNEMLGLVAEFPVRGECPYMLHETDSRAKQFERKIALVQTERHFDLRCCSALSITSISYS